MYIFYCSYNFEIKYNRKESASIYFNCKMCHFTLCTDMLHRCPSQYAIFFLKSRGCNLKEEKLSNLSALCMKKAEQR